ncbi:hypothetical protein [Hyalangium versicolor]|nr:hypothetical protein [Hyalangium versicolor]
MPEYAQIKPQGPGPVHLGPDEMGRHRFSFTVQLKYVAAVARGLMAR